MDLFSDKASELIPLDKVVIPDELRNRLSTSIPCIDAAIGGGLVRGSSILFGGDPGVGKTTLLLQILGEMSERGVRCVYDSAEESAAQLKMTTERIKLAPNDQLLVGNISEVLTLIESVKEHGTEVLVVDSIQGLRIDTCDASAGSNKLLSESCDRLIRFAKDNKIPLIIVCQFNKDGTFRGPKGLEHNVDAVAVLKTGKEPDKYRLFFVQKNRFGPTQQDIHFPWIGSEGRYSFDDAEIQKASADVRLAEVAKIKKAHAELRQLNLNTTQATDVSPEYDHRTKIAVAVAKFKQYRSKDVEILKEILDQTRAEMGRFLIQEGDCDIFGVSLAKMKRLLQSLSQDPRFSSQSEEPWIILV